MIVQVTFKSGAQQLMDMDPEDLGNLTTALRVRKHQMFSREVNNGKVSVSIGGLQLQSPVWETDCGAAVDLDEVAGVSHYISPARGGELAKEFAE